MKDMTFRNTVAVAILAGAFVAPGVALTHHSAIAFDETRSVEVTGTVTTFIWRNPHLIVHVEAEGSDGEPEVWPIEGQSIAMLIRAGFDRDVVQEGDRITVRVHPMKNGTPGGLLQGLVSADGTAYSMDGSDAPEARRQPVPSLVAYVPPPAGETLQMREEKTRPPNLPIVSDGTGTGDSEATGLMAGALDPDNLARERPAPPFDLTGVWQFRGEDQWRANYGSYEFKPMPELTAKGQAFYDAYMEAAAQGDRYFDPTAACYPAGMPRLMTRYGSLMMLQYPTVIFMVSRLSNEYRVIYLDGRDRLPESRLDRNWSGESLGHWDGDTLVIETEGFTDENHLMQAGIITGTQLRITERYRLINDGDTLVMDFSFEDPEHWVGEWNHVKFRDRVLRSDIKEANCIPADNLALPGLG